MTKKALILGCGVAGLSCGLLLQEKQYKVKIIAANFPPQTTSNIAAAIWFPYKAYPEDKVLKWSKAALLKFRELSQNPATGVSFVEFVELFDHKVSEPWWKPAVEHFRYLSPEEFSSPYQDGYLAEVPLIETPLYMPYIFNRFQELGGELEQYEFSSFQEDYFKALADEYSYIINCMGLGAKKVCNDSEVFPIRGQVIRINNPGIQRCYTDENGPLGISYILARREDCILGGTSEEGVWDETIHFETSEEIFEKCQQIEPKLKEAKILEHKVGLRPGRKTIRLESEPYSPQCTLIHNYGHGGSGFTLSWGCANEVLRLMGIS